MHNDETVAKQIIHEIIKQSGDEIVGTTRLFKAFYFAHLYYAKEHVAYLSEWPIVKMPYGPGIDNFDRLADSLHTAGLIDTAIDDDGPYQTTAYRVTDKTPPWQPLAPSAVEAIHKAIRFVAGKSAAELSDLTHERSRSWNNAGLGDELGIYVDLLSDEDYEARRQRNKLLAQEISDAWGD